VNSPTARAVRAFWTCGEREREREREREIFNSNKVLGSNNATQGKYVYLGHLLWKVLCSFF